MRRYKSRENKDQLAFSFRKRLSWKSNFWLLLLMLVVFVFSGRAAWRSYLKDRESSLVVMDKQNELRDLEERESFLLSELYKLNTDEGREASLREKFGVGRPGENVAIIVESENTGPARGGAGVWNSIKTFFREIFN